MFKSHAKDTAVVSCPARKKVQRLGMMESVGKLFADSVASTIKSSSVVDPSELNTPLSLSAFFCSHDSLKEVI